MANVFGYVRKEKEAQDLFDACLQGVIPLTPARLTEAHRAMIAPGKIHIFEGGTSQDVFWGFFLYWESVDCRGKRG